MKKLWHNKRFKKYFFITLSVVFLIGLWWILSATPLFRDTGVIPSPPQALVQMGRAAATATLWLNVWNTLWKILLAFFISFVLAFLFAILAAWRAELQHFLSPIMTFLRALPVVGVVLILFMVIRRPEMAAVVIGVMMVFPVMYQSFLTAIKETDKKLLQMASVHKVPFIRKVTGIYAPHMAPHIVGSSVSAIGMTLKVVIAAEIIGLPLGNTLGTAMYDASRNIANLGLLFMWLIVAVLLNFILEGIIKLIGFIAMPWKRKLSKNKAIKKTESSLKQSKEIENKLEDEDKSSLKQPQENEKNKVKEDENCDSS